jgi:hypothetical protein
LYAIFNIKLVEIKMKAIFFFVVVFALVILCPCKSISQKNYNFYISNSGSDSNSGTSKKLPRQTITQTVPLIKNLAALNGSVSIGLKVGNVFNEAFLPSSTIQLGSYTDAGQKNSFAILNGSAVYDSGWVKEIGTLNTFKQDIPLSGFTGNGTNGIGQYSYVYIIEIDKELEKTKPFTARKILQFVSDHSALDTIAGSFYEPVTTTENPKTIYIHTSDGSSPNSNLKYRYEVSVQGRAVNSAAYSNNRFENLWVRGYGVGQGMMPSGSNSYYNKIIFGPGAAIHHIGVASGIINRSLFLPGPKNTDEFAVVFYDVQGEGRHNKISNSIFLDIPQPIYSHISYGTTYKLWYKLCRT